MTLEATMICIDTSERMRNGDVEPTRFQAQADSVNLLAGSKTQANPESSVGVLNLAGGAPRVLVTPTTDLGTVLNAVRSTELGGDVDILAGAQVAQLALKHRQNKSQRQRVVMFVASPVQAEEKDLTRIGKKLKKNNVAMDVVNFGGDMGENQTKLQTLIDAVNNDDNSHLVNINPESESLSDTLLSSPIFADVAGTSGSGFAAAAAASAAAAGQQASNVEGMDIEGVDPNVDPELAMALRVSMEEERARQEQAAAQQSGEPGGQEQQGTQQQGEGGQGMDMDEDSLLQEALQMSMQENQQQQQQQGQGEAERQQGQNDEEDELAMALRMSREDSGGNQGGDQGQGN